MVKVTKVAVWKIGDRFIESAAEATKAARLEIIREMLVNEENQFAGQGPAEWMSSNWDAIEAKTKAAMTGA